LEVPLVSTCLWVSGCFCLAQAQEKDATPEVGGGPAIPAEKSYIVQEIRDGMIGCGEQRSPKGSARVDMGCASKIKGGFTKPIVFNVNGQSVTDESSGRSRFCGFCAKTRGDRREVWLRDGSLRLLHGSSQRQCDPFLRHSGGAGITEF
jgi:hypothetical protein